MRSGWDSKNIVVVEAGKVLEESGISAVTLHGRTTKQGYTGYSNWDLIKLLKESVNIPVIGNGDVNSVDKYHEMIDYTKCDGGMIGRGALGNPWIFEQILNSLNGKKISTLVNDIMQPGYYEVSWDANTHSSGLYFVKMTAGESITTQTLMLVK